MGNNVTIPPGFGYKSSNSPFFTPVKNAVISARVYISAGPEGCLELRTAIAPSPSSATSTQLPAGIADRALAPGRGDELITWDANASEHAKNSLHRSCASEPGPRREPEAAAYRSSR